MIIDCDLCAMQHTSACDDCAVGFLLDRSGPVEFHEVEVEAIGHLSEVGLVAPIRLVPRRTGRDEAAGDVLIRGQA